MPPLVLDPPTGTPTNRSDLRVTRGGVAGWGILPSAMVIAWGGDGADVIVPAEQHRDVEFEREKQAFLALSPFALAPYRGQYVASRSGTIIDSDRDLSVLVTRVFQTNANLPVYITRLEPDAGDVRFDTPFFG